jgi:toxin CcdB
LRQFDVFQNPSNALRDIVPYLVVLQSHHLKQVDSMVVAPLFRNERPLSEVDIPLTFRDEDLVLLVSEIGSIDRSGLRKSLGSLAAHEDAIRRALDRLFTGF